MTNLTLPDSAVSSVDDELLNALTDEYSRTVLLYFRYFPTREATLDALERFVCDLNGQDAGEAHVGVYLHHSILPRLADVGLVDYDEESHTVRYRDHPSVELWLDHVSERGEGMA